MPITLQHQLTDGSRSPVRVGPLLLTLVVGMAGCSDLQSTLRDELVLESETLDRIRLVVNEPTAKEYDKTFTVGYLANRKEKITEKKAEYLDKGKMEKLSSRIWDAYDDLLKALLGLSECPEHKLMLKDDEKSQARYEKESKLFKAIAEADGKFDALALMGGSRGPDLCEAAIKERLLQLHEEKEGNRKVEADKRGEQFTPTLAMTEKDWDKGMETLPPPKFLNRYMREKFALRLARARENERLSAVVKSMVEEDETVQYPELKKVLEYLQGKKK